MSCEKDGNLNINKPATASESDEGEGAGGGGFAFGMKFLKNINDQPFDSVNSLFTVSHLIFSTT